MKVSDLEGALLDFWVARAMGLPLCSEWNTSAVGIMVGTGAGDLRQFYPSTDWAHGGPIIEREEILLEPDVDGWHAILGMGKHYCAMTGSNPLIAAMRCLVAFKFGEEVPDEELKAPA